MEMGVGKILMESLVNWSKDKKIVKYVLTLYIFIIATLVLGFVFNVLIFGETYLKLFGLSPPNFLDYSSLKEFTNALTNYSSAFSEYQSAVKNNISIMFIFQLFVFLASIIFSSLVVMLIISRNLKLAGFQPSDFSIGKVIKFISVIIVNFFLALFSIYSKHFRIIVYLFYFFLAATFLLPIIVKEMSIMSPMFSFITILFGIAYFFVVIHNTLRLVLGIVVVSEKDCGIIDATKESWKMMKGKVLAFFKGLAAILLIFYVVYFLASFILSLIALVVFGQKLFIITTASQIGQALTMPIFVAVLNSYYVIFYARAQKNI